MNAVACELNEPCHEFGDVGIGLLGCGHSLVPPTTCGGIDDTMTFWEGLLPQGDGPNQKNEVQGLVPKETNAFTSMVGGSSGTATERTDLPTEWSSTYSSNDICVLVDVEKEHDLAINNDNEVSSADAGELYTLLLQ